MTESVSENGSRWFKVDFHLHTRTDKEFTYEGESDRFIGDYVEALKKAYIGLGVISNHNKFEVDEFKALRKKTKKSGIGLLPGVELSIKDG